MREAGLRVALPHVRVEPGAARDDQRIDHRRPRSEEGVRPPNDAVAQPAPPAPRRVEQPGAPHHQHAAIF